MSKTGLIISYTLAAVLGWGGAVVLNGRGRDNPATTPSKNPGRTAVTNRDSPIDGDQLIEDLQRSLEGSGQDSQGEIEARFEDFKAEYERLKAELTPTDDQENTFRDLFTHLAADTDSLLEDNPATPELAVRYHQWMLQDPAAALRFLTEARPRNAALRQMRMTD